MIWAASGNTQAAVQWAKDRELSIQTPLSNLRELELYALANILYSQKRTEEADLLLTRLIQGAESGSRWYFIVDMRLLRTLIFIGRSQNEAALVELIKAMEVAENI